MTLQTVRPVAPSASVRIKGSKRFFGKSQPFPVVEGSGFSIQPHKPTSNQSEIVDSTSMMKVPRKM